MANLNAASGLLSTTITTGCTTTTATGNITGSIPFYQYTSASTSPPSPFVIRQQNVNQKTPNLTIHNRSVPIGETFNNSRDLYTVDWHLEEYECLYFHYLIWIELYKNDFDDYGTVFKSECGIFPAFGKIDTRLHFEEWLDRYTDIFYSDREISKTSIPQPISGKLSGFCVDDGQPDYPYDVTANPFVPKNTSTYDDFLTWAWIVSHCRSSVLRLHRGWLFTDETDAVMFKMR